MSVLSYKPEVQIGSDPKWCGNALRFATRKEAENSALGLSLRWLAVTDFRASESNDPVNYKHVNGQDVRIEPEQTLFEEGDPAQFAGYNSKKVELDDDYEDRAEWRNRR